MFTVKIELDGKLVCARTANRIAGGIGKLSLYVIDDGTVIEHHYDHGAAALVIKMLANVKNTLKCAHERKIKSFDRKLKRIAEDDNQ